ncbi:MAG TPA: ribosome maturation factor RimM [Burkholderiales bacterium]|nr:ribosome maturation factor RimM [Burkholderiales bacterium]
MGRVAGSYGVRGWIRVRPYSVEPEALAAHRRWRIGAEDYGVEETKVHSGALLARLPGIGTREQALRLKGKTVSVPRSALPELDAGQYYWADLVGLEVVNAQGSVLGVVQGLFSNGAHDVMELAGDRSTRLVPFLPAVVKKVDLEGRRIEVEWGAEW